jgi:hypothetical protein
MAADDIHYTPLLSPSVENSFDMRTSAPPDIAMPGSYFSPIPSPIIDARSGPSSASSSNRPSPSSAPKRGGSAKTTPVLAPSNVKGGRIVKNSPVIKAKRRSIAQSLGVVGSTTAITGDDAVSPETLSDIMIPPNMPPPQQPPISTVTRKESISSNSSVTSIVEPSTPVTPAILMNLPANRVNPVANTEDRLQNAIRTTVNLTSRPARRASSAASSPLSTPIMPKPPIQRWGSRSSSVSASPVLKPKVYSPAMSPQTHPNMAADLSALLASKSNYQTIIEGTHNQLGLSYPEHLSAGLASKKTSHKLAEQGRRNRINSALSELAGLISPDAPPNSKADTVESAILYIKDLQTELAETKEELATLKQK